MAEFQEVMRQWGLYCKAYTDNHNDDCSGCPFEIDGSCNSYAKDNAECAEQIEKHVTAWAAEHPEPVYPTWGTWLAEVTGQVIEGDLLYTPIPADIAQKLGIEPKGGKIMANWKMTGKIICGYPGVGKSTVAANRTDIVDAESSGFSHPFNFETQEFEVNDEFPKNYVEHIKKLASELGGYEYVLVSCHKEVRDELDAQSIPYVVVIPDVGCKDEYLKRYLKRGDSVAFISQMYANWEDWHEEIEQNAPAVIHLSAGETLADILP